MTNSRFEDLLASARTKFAAKGGGRGVRKPLVRREYTRQVVKVSMFDDVQWTGTDKIDDPLLLLDGPVVGVRHDSEIDAMIDDLFFGDADRPGYYNSPELVRDLFNLFERPSPVFRKKVEVKKDARLNQKFLVQVQELSVYEEFHDYTALDAEDSKRAVLAFAPVIKEMIKAHREAVEKANEERLDDQPDGPAGDDDDKIWDKEDRPKSNKPKGDGDKGGGKGQESGDQGGGSSGGGSGSDEGGKDGESQFGDKEGSDKPDTDHGPDYDHRNDPDTDPDAAGSGDDELDSEPQDADADDDSDEDEDGSDNELLDDLERDFAEDWADQDYDDESEWDQLLDGFDIGSLANSVMKDQVEQAADLSSARAGIGLDDAEWKMMDPKARKAIADRLNTPRMKAIADMVGRMKRFALAKQASKITDAPHEIYTVEQGNDLRRVLRSEFGFLGHPDTKIEFYRRYAAGELLQYKERGHEDVGKGPIICCIDNSGSMSGAPENWAKGVAEALRRICQEQGRDFHAIYFETNTHRERFDFPQGKGPFDKVMAFLGISAGGGTQFDGVLTEALNKAVNFFEGKPEHGKSDIVFITDGAAHLDDAWIDKFNAERTAAGVRVYSIFISAYDSTQSSAMQLLRRFSDSAIPVKALEVNDEATDKLFAQI